MPSRMSNHINRGANITHGMLYKIHLAVVCTRTLSHRIHTAHTSHKYNYKSLSFFPHHKMLRDFQSAEKRSAVKKISNLLMGRGRKEGRNEEHQALIFLPVKFLRMPSEAFDIFDDKIN